jgi:hypothetical protein
MDKDFAGIDLSWEDYFEYFRYIFNIVFIAIPWFVLSLGLLVLNIYMNIDWNEWWGEGNAWLIVNTVYFAIQFFISNLLALELPIFVRAFRITRFVSIWSGVLYIVVYFIAMFEWYDMLYLVTDKTTYDFVTIIVNMVLGYNLVLHVPILPVLVFIIFKEATMEFFQFLNPDGGKETDTVAMNNNDW